MGLDIETNGTARTRATGQTPVTRRTRRTARTPKGEKARGATRERLIRCGIEILTEKGFASTGIDEILRKVGVPKGSFYHYFASKDDFGQAVIEGYAAYFAAKLDRWLLDDNVSPLSRMRNFVADAKNGMARHDFRRGCLIGNMGQELGTTHADFRDALEAVFCDWQTRITHCLQAAQAEGEIASGADCARLAEFFWIGWEGAILRAKLTRSNAPLDLFAEFFFAGLPR
ncbi:MAG: TetR/AcrR family transcriptional regulator [Fimbriimonadaceae bacterium]|nr:TetR/AcrR family transcriptional regulator [Alphaproteobacteria bacterium]